MRQASMAPDITNLPEKGTRNERKRSRLRRLWPRRAAPDNNSPGLKSPEAAPVVVEQMKENTKVAAEVLGGGGASPTGSGNERENSHGKGDSDRAEDDKKTEDGDDAADDTGSHADIDTGNDSDSTEGGEALGSLPNFWEKAWNSDKVGDDRRTLLHRHLAKPAGSGKKPAPAAFGSSSQKIVVDGVIKDTQERMASYTARWGSGDDYKTTLGVARSILLSAQTVKTLLDSVVQFDPTGYSSAAWTVISISLTVCLVVVLSSFRWLIKRIRTVGQKRPGPHGSHL